MIHAEQHLLQKYSAIDVILDSNIAVAKPHVSQVDQSDETSTSPMDTSGDVDSSQSSSAMAPTTRYTRNKSPRADLKHASMDAENRPGRFRLRLITAELARQRAKKTPTELSESTNDLLAFDGEFVGGNTTFVSVISKSLFSD